MKNYDISHIAISILGGFALGLAFSLILMYFTLKYDLKHKGYSEMIDCVVIGKTIQIKDIIKESIK